MARADRAMQFAPFAALKGFEEALRKKEFIEVPKAELSEEALEYLDYKISQIKCKDIVTVIYYVDGQYVKKEGVVSKLDVLARILTIVTTDISFDDIKDIRF